MRPLGILILAGILVVLCGLSPAMAAPAGDAIPTPEWIFFYSRALKIDGAPAQPGAVIQAFVSRTNLECGAQVVGSAGELPLLTCYMADPISHIEGVQGGDVIYFKVDGVPVSSTYALPATIHNGDRFELLELALQAAPVAVPEPTSIVLLGAGLAGMAAYIRKRRRA